MSVDDDDVIESSVDEANDGSEPQTVLAPAPTFLQRAESTPDAIKATIHVVATRLKSAYQIVAQSLLADSAQSAADNDARTVDYDVSQTLRLSSDTRDVTLLALRAAISVAVGIAIGLTGFLIATTVTTIIVYHIRTIRHFFTYNDMLSACIVMTAITLALLTGAALTVTYGSFQTRASGVGRLTAYLSGIHSNKFLSRRTLFFKSVGLIMAVSAYIKQGIEGPFFHIGAMVGKHVTELIVHFLSYTPLTFSKYASLLSAPVDLRMFITAGAAAGFSVAFNAPIAGVLYVMDTATAYWSHTLTFHTFLCTMVAVTTVNLCFAHSDVLPSRGLIDLSNAIHTELRVGEFVGFVLVGVVGGGLSALFTRVNFAAERWRRHSFGSQKLPNIVDVLICGGATILFSFILPLLLPCADKDGACDVDTDSGVSLRCIQFHCSPKEYSPLATLLFTVPESTLRILYDRTPLDANRLGENILLTAIFLVAYFLMSSLTYGMSVPGGLFVPSMIIGAAYGRFISLIVSPIYGHLTTVDTLVLGVDTGVYAVLGSAAFLGGITRMTVPITIMMVEITSDTETLIPIMLVVIIAKVIADRLIPSLYTLHLQIEGLVTLLQEAPPSYMQRHGWCARDMMTSPVQCIHIVNTRSAAVTLLRRTTYELFPVVTSPHVPTHTHRRELTATLESKESPIELRPLRPSHSDQDIHMFNRREKQSLETHDDAPPPPLPADVFLGVIHRSHLTYVIRSMPQFPTAEAARDSEASTANNTSLPMSVTSSPLSSPSSSTGADDGWINVGSFVDDNCYIVSESTSSQRVWQLFRLMGMSIILVLDIRHRVVGIITRDDLIRWQAQSIAYNDEDKYRSDRRDNESHNDDFDPHTDADEKDELDVIADEDAANQNHRESNG